MFFGYSANKLFSSFLIFILYVTPYLCNAQVNVNDQRQIYATRSHLKNCGISSFRCESGECIEEEKLCDGKEDCRDGSDETRDCINIIPCASKLLFQCDYGACIKRDRVCDGKADCKDNSDEKESACSPNNCEKGQFKCISDGKCIENYNICDGAAHCNDGSDETSELCSDINCPRFTYRCQYGGCVNRNARCNEKIDCLDGSDELGCPSVTTTHQIVPIKPLPSCGVDKFMCKSGECIDEELECNGKYDCSDGSDEVQSTCSLISCPSYTFRCDYGACIDQNARCNGVIECVDNSDELACHYNTKPQSTPIETVPTTTQTYGCSYNEFKCNQGQCIKKERLCDGYYDCADRSDETISACSNNACTSFSFRCAYGACVNRNARCNGIEECADGSDEKFCAFGTTPAITTTTTTTTTTNKPNVIESITQKYGCTNDEFRCYQGQCIKQEKLCDGRYDCGDGSDESYGECIKIKCPTANFRCAYGACVNMTAKCNGVKDCIDASDERFCSSGTTNITNGTDVSHGEAPIVFDSCVFPNNPKNGQYSIPKSEIKRYQNGDIVPNYSVLVTGCNWGYKINTPANVPSVCVEGKWIPPVPKCLKTCPRITETDVECKLNKLPLESCDDAVEGTIAMVPCKPVDGDPENKQSVLRVCEDGVWNSSIFQCITTVQPIPYNTTINIFIIKDKFS